MWWTGQEQNPSCQNHPKPSGTAAGLQQPWCCAAAPIPLLCSTRESRAGNKDPNPVPFLNASVNEQRAEGSGSGRAGIISEPWRRKLPGMFAEGLPDGKVPVEQGWGSEGADAWEPLGQALVLLPSLLSVPQTRRNENKYGKWPF